ncbi:MAG: succinate dehydrogenase assembly factor 2 [Gammaproteobacteria bacterium]|nr:succinate dehydrogenase assembly factor 2 [Gammaproteobacteria bacterium]MDG1951352.1 succinate dehydrogenase assembly factor 2 [Gammaproteobacteria bacterium]MDG2118701.1 succinate dehydrogenase assembly factor 2 [Gammaproteobacteria bacterium]
MEELNPRKIFWHSRRGMLELDLLLVPFSQNIFASLSYEEQLLYRDLLAEEDQNLWDWLVIGQEPSELRFEKIIDRILVENSFGGQK